MRIQVLTNPEGKPCSTRDMLAVYDLLSEATGGEISVRIEGRTILEFEDSVGRGVGVVAVAGYKFEILGPEIKPEEMRKAKERAEIFGLELRARNLPGLG